MIKGNTMLFVLGTAAGIFFLSASLALGIALKQFFQFVGAFGMPQDVATQVERDVHSMQGRVQVPYGASMQTAGYSYIPAPAPYPQALR